MHLVAFHHWLWQQTSIPATEISKVRNVIAVSPSTNMWESSTACNCHATSLPVKITTCPSELSYTCSSYTICLSPNSIRHQLLRRTKELGGRQKHFWCTPFVLKSRLLLAVHCSRHLPRHPARQSQNPQLFLAQC